MRSIRPVPEANRIPYRRLNFLNIIRIFAVCTGFLPLILGLTFWTVSFEQAVAAPPQFLLPKIHFGSADLAVIVNDDDPLSRRIADYYQERRGIPQANMIHVRFVPGNRVMSTKDFARIKAEVDRSTPPTVQAYALTWTLPYRVGCMSITSAFAFDFDKAYCANCLPTKASPYFNSPSLVPYRDFGMRPTIALAGIDFDHVKALIDRGIAADETHPAGTGYLVSTTDKNRNVRAVTYPDVVRSTRGWIQMEEIHGNFIKDRNDVLFYFTGLTNVLFLDTLKFVPGALADHLTSAGGNLTNRGQMSALRWLEAGATASYGTVVEPCNFPAKFPDPGTAIFWYLRGESLIEAYWKSVAWPGEGIFVGEPLAAPFAGYSTAVEGDEVVLRTQALPPGIYALLGADSAIGPYRSVPKSRPIVVGTGKTELRFRDLDRPFYSLARVR